MLESITEYYRVLQSITKTNLAHLLRPIFGLVFSWFAFFLTPLHPISRGRLYASKPARIKSSVNLSYLVVFLYKIVRGLSAQPEVFLLASLARRLTPGPAFAQ